MSEGTSLPRQAAKLTAELAAQLRLFNVSALTPLESAIDLIPTAQKVLAHLHLALRIRCLYLANLFLMPR